MTIEVYKEMLNERLASYFQRKINEAKDQNQVATIYREVQAVIRQT